MGEIQRILIELPFPGRIDKDVVAKLATAILDACKETDIIHGLGMEPVVTYDPPMTSYLADLFRQQGRDVRE
jgi:hypothetical protein